MRSDGSVQCWGDDDYGQATPPRGEFVSVNAGWYSTCGVKTDGFIACWGEQAHGVAQADFPAEP